MSKPKRKIFKPIQFLIAGLALFASATNAAVASADDTTANPLPQQSRQAVWVTPKYDSSAIASSNRVHFGLAFTGGLENRLNGSSIRVYSADGSQAKICDTTLKCTDEAFKYVEAFGALELCATAKAAPCVESLEYKIGKGNFDQAQFAFTVDPSPTAADIAQLKSSGATEVQLHSGWPANAFATVPASASGPLVFHLPNATNRAGTDTYALESSYRYNTAAPFTSGQISNFHISVVPVLDDPSSRCESAWYQYQLNNHPAINGVGCASDQRGYYSIKSTGWAAGFPDGLTLRLKLRLNSALGGWFQGRLENPSVKVEAQSGDENLVTVEASPTIVPTTATPIPMFDASMYEVTQILGITGDFWAPYQAKDGKSPGILLETGDTWTPARGGTKLIGLVADRVGNTAKGQVSAWEFKQLGASDRCMNDNRSLQGLLTTNAMTYQADLPRLQNGLLNYSVAGLHYDSSGSVFQGSYNFIMKDSVARCLYGFNNNAPISGSVSVTSSDGNENVATTSVTDDGEWLKLSALGFTFSNPTISAKLTQVAQPTATSTPIAASTIRCIKGKLIKKVTSAKPKCPAGFKQK